MPTSVTPRRSILPVISSAHHSPSPSSPSGCPITSALSKPQTSSASIRSSIKLSPNASSPNAFALPPNGSTAPLSSPQSPATNPSPLTLSPPMSAPTWEVRKNENADLVGQTSVCNPDPRSSY